MDAAAGHQAGDRQTDRQTLKAVGVVEKKGEPKPDGPRAEHIDGRIRFGKH